MATDRLTEYWAVNNYHEPYEMRIKTAYIVGISKFTSDIEAFKLLSKHRIINILNKLDANVDDISLTNIANTILDEIPEITYVEISSEDDTGLTVYRET